MARKSFNLKAILLLVLCTMSKADEEFKQKFGKEFITDMKRYHADLLQAYLKHLDDVFQTILYDFDPTPEQGQKFRRGLDTIQELKARIGTTITLDAVKRVKDFGERVVYELMQLNSDPAVLNSPRKTRIVNKALDGSFHLEAEDAKIFQNKIYERYHEMYGKIPKEELNANPEYTKIDETMERVKNAAPSKTPNISAFFDYLSVFKLLADFFDVPEYKEIFT